MNQTFTEGIYTDAHKILNKLEERAKLLEGQKNDAATPSYGTSDANDERYKTLHNLIVKFHEFDMSYPRFYAACDLIDKAANTALFPDGKRPGEELLYFKAICGSEQINLFAEHNRYHQTIRHMQVTGESKELPAPVTQIPFGDIRQAMQIRLTIALSGWTQPLPHSDLTYKYFSTKDDMQKCLSYLIDVEQMIQEHHKSFSLHLSVANKCLPFMLEVNHVDLKFAQQLMGYVEATPKTEPTPHNDNNSMRMRF